MRAFFLARLQHQYNEAQPLVGLFYGSPAEVLDIADEESLSPLLEFAGAADAGEYMLSRGFGLFTTSLRSEVLHRGEAILSTTELTSISASEALRTLVAESDHLDWVPFNEFVERHRIEQPAPGAAKDQA